jgi:hypothetical protein
LNRRSKTRWILRAALLPCLAGIFLLGTLFSQSLADLARQERARKSREGKTGKVFTNDDIRSSAPSPPAPAPTAAKDIQGKPSEAPAKEAADGKDAKTPAAGGKEEPKPPEDSAKKQAELEKQYRDRFAKLREALAYEEKKLDVMQRELSLMQTQYYSDPNVAMREQTFRGQINQRTQEIEQQKAAVDKSKQAISDLEEELRKKGLPPGWSR